MHKKSFFLAAALLAMLTAFSQEKKDSVVKVDDNYIRLSEIVVNSKLNVPYFIQRIKNDTTFYKAFRNLRIVGYTAVNDIKMLNSAGAVEAALHSNTEQIRKGNCRTMKVISQTSSGNMFDEQKNFNYYTAQLYAGLFFTKDSVCGENNIVKGYEFSTNGLSGIEKHKEQLKMLFFNPGKKINGIPFISSKTEIFDPSMADKYYMSIDVAERNSIPCYIFKVKAKPEKRNSVVIDEMTTWFDEKTFEIVARDYALSYDAGIYDFDVKMQVEMTKTGDLLVPAVLHYNGNWKAIFKKREHGIFTATLSDFVRT